VVSQAGANETRFELIFTTSVTQIAGLSKGQSKVSLYPNPVQGGKYTLGLTNITGQIEVEVTDMVGRLVDSFTFSSKESISEQSFVTPSKSGQYIVKVKGSQASFVQSLIVR
jgi:hypothetical protein